MTISEQYRSGLTLQRIATMRGWSREAVRQRLIALGVRRRRARGKCGIFDKAKAARVLARRRSGQTYDEIMLAESCCRKFVAKVLRVNGLTKWSRK